MKSIKGSLAVKITAIFSFVILMFTTLLSGIGIAFLVTEEAYFDNGKQLRQDAVDLASGYYQGDLYDMLYLILLCGYTEERAGFDKVFGEERCNYLFEVRDEEGNIVLTNHEGGLEDIPFLAIYEYPYNPYYHYFPYPEIDGIDSEKNWYYITAVVPENLDANDGIYYLWQAGNWLANARYALVIYAASALIVSIIIFIFLMCAAGHRRGREDIVPNFVDLVPFDIYLAVFAAMFLLTGFIVDEMQYHEVIFVVALPFVGIVWLLMCISLMMTFATRVKLRSVFRNTVVMWIFRVCWQIIKTIFRLILSIPLFLKGVALYVIVCSAELFFLMWGYGEFVVFWILEKGALGLALLALLINLRKLLAAGRRLSAGETDYKVDTSLMFGEFREHAYNLNGIGSGLQNAVDKSIKSERMKAELITNVSHDIKTPLTSIINYVDLLKREGLDSEHAGEYLEVLDRQSARLKKLTEDLIEASKASTGNIKVNAERLDANILLSQAIGEYEEKLNNKNLFMVTDMAEGEMFVYSDGRLLWRVFDNMLNNIAKYAKQDTRVYISTSKVNNEINIVFKNISDAPLNISSDELMERFVRGDSSRNTEGSGLGLSIARSLTELMGGKFEITIDGDLFKCSMRFAAKN